MFDIGDGIGHGGFYPVRREGGHNPCEQAFVLDEEEGDEDHGEQAHAYIGHYRNHGTQHAGDGEIGREALEVVQNKPHGIKIRGQAGDDSPHPAVDVFYQVAFRQVHVAEQGGVPDNVHHHRDNLGDHQDEAAQDDEDGNNGQQPVRGVFPLDAYAAHPPHKGTADQRYHKRQDHVDERAPEVPAKQEDGGGYAQIDEIAGQFIDIALFLHKVQR